MGNFKCNDCGAEISPQWKNALRKNECPGCSGMIMSETEQDLIIEIGEAMEKMPNDSIGVAGWIVSNFKLQKIGDCEPVEKFHDKSNKKVPEHKDSSKMSNDKISSFFKNAGFDVDKVKQAEQAKAKALSGGDITGTDIYDDDDDDFDQNYFDEDTINAVDEVNNLLVDSENNNDTAKARAFLEQKRMKQLEVRKNIANGIGAVSRSGEPAGFRRT